MLEKSLCSSEEPDVHSHSVASQSDSLLQIDQGFHEGGEGIVSVDTIGSSLLLDSSSESPLTPVNLLPDGLEFDQISPSSTIVDDFQQHELAEGSLNKSESQDSGLQSENVSTSDTVTVDSPQLVARDIGALCRTTAPEGDKKGKESVNTKTVDTEKENRDSHSCDHSEKSCDNNTGSNNTDESDLTCSNTGSCVNTGLEHTRNEAVEICSGILDEIVSNATESSESNGASMENEYENDMSNRKDSDDTLEKENSNREIDCETPFQTSGAGNDSDAPRAQGVSRQFSWQYNVQFALPRISLPDVDRQSSDSFSSDSTISDTGNNPESVSDFVIETLANMNASSEARSRDSQTQARPSSKGSHKVVKSVQKGKSPQKHVKKGICATSGLNSSRRGSIDLSLPSTSQMSSQNQAAKPKPMSAQDKRDSVENISCETGPTVELPADSKKLTDTGNKTTAEDTAISVAGVEQKDCSEGEERVANTDVSATGGKAGDAGSISSSCSSCQTTSSACCDCESEQNWLVFFSELFSCF